MRRDSREGAADGSLRKGRQMSSTRRSNASCAVRRRRGWMDESFGLGIHSVDGVRPSRRLFIMRV